jgi:hypothetical protein
MPKFFQFFMKIINIFSVREPLERISERGNSNQSDATAKLPETPTNAIESYDVDGAKVAIVPGRYILLEPEMPKDFEKVLRDVILYFSFSKPGNPEEGADEGFSQGCWEKENRP